MIGSLKANRWKLVRLWDLRKVIQANPGIDKRDGPAPPGDLPAAPEGFRGGESKKGDPDDIVP